MPPAHDILVLGLILPPFLGAYLLTLWLGRYRRDGRGIAAQFITLNFRLLSPDLYNDEGQRPLRWAWGLTVFSLVWLALMLALVAK